MITQQQALEDQEQKEQAAVEMTIDGNPLDQEKVEEQLREITAMRVAMMDAVGQQLEGHLREACQFRSAFESDWVEDIRQFEHGDPRGGGDLTETKERPSDNEWKGAVDNITRYATITYAARLSDMLFPTNDRNWDIDNTPKPELPPEIMANLEETFSIMVQEGKATEEKRYEVMQQLVLAAARLRTSRMRVQIDDQLAESNYSDQGRDGIYNACRIGHGVIKGPFAQVRRRRRYVAGQGFKAQVEEILNEPKVKSVDPWLVFPRPCRRMADCPGVFELHELSAKRLSDLRLQAGFSEEQINRLLKQAPSWSAIGSTIQTMRDLHDSVISAKNENYAVFEYNGEMPKEAVAIFLDQLMAESKIDEDARQKIMANVEESNNVHLNCCVWFSQGVVLKVAVSPVEYEGCMYKFFTFEEHESAPFGKGVPRILRDTQTSVRQLWQSIMLNALMSAAPQIAVMKGQLELQNGAADLRFTKPRVWSFVGEMDDVRKIMQVWTIDNIAQQVLPVYERAKMNGQEQIMLPQIGQGEPVQGMQTSSGMAMLMNASNIVQRRMAARYDTEVTTPLLRSWYEWNMEHGEEEAKGDYKVIPRASSHLLVKDIHAQHFFMALNLYSTNPKLEPRMRWDAWGEEGMKILDMDADRFLLSDEEFAKVEEAMAQQQPPQDPAMLRAEAAMNDSQTRSKTADMNAQIAQAKLDAQREDRALDYEDSIADRETRENIAAMSVQAAMAGLDKDQQVRVMAMQAKMQSDAERNATQTRIAGMKAAENAERIAAKERSDLLEIQAEQQRPTGPVLS